MSITYGEAKKILSQYAGHGGRCPDTAEVDLFCRQVFQQMLYSGQYGNLRKFCFNAVNTCFTAPYELETPMGVKVDGVVGNVWNKWYEFHEYGDMDECRPASNALYEEPNTFPTVYDLPSSFCRVGVLGTAEEDKEAHLIVAGLDASGREIITSHQGEQISGEYLRIQKGALRYTQVQFATITSVKKSKTNGYVQLLWYRPELGTRGFLADYSPFEEVPQYRRFKITTPNCGSCVKVTILGRIRLKDHYADSDIIPFDNLYALQVAGQGQNAQFNNDPAMADAKDKVLLDIINRENDYKKSQTGTPVSINRLTSAGAVKNII